MKDRSCVFCKIVAGEIPAEIIHETEGVITFVDNSPANFGHCLVAPKTHYKNIYTIPEKIWADMNIEAKNIARAIKKSMGVEGINIISNNEPAAGQVIFHSHIHVVPRLTNDGFKWWPTKKYQFDNQKKEIGDKIRAELI